MGDRQKHFSMLKFAWQNPLWLSFTKALPIKGIAVLTVIGLALGMTACGKKSTKNKINTTKAQGEGEIFSGVSESYGIFGSGELNIAQARAIIADGTFNPKAKVTLKKAEKGLSESPSDELLSVALSITSSDGSPYTGTVNLPIEMHLKVEALGNVDWVKVGVFNPDTKTLKSLIATEFLTLTKTETNKYWISFTTVETNALFIPIDPLSIDPKFSINEDAAFSKLADVTLDFLASSSSYTVRKIGEGEDCSGATTIPDSAISLDWTLSHNDGAKIVCAYFENYWGDSISSTSTIFLDTTPPTSSVITSGDISADYTPGGTTVLLGAAIDEGSGLQKVEVALSNDNGVTCLDETLDGFTTPCPVWHIPDELEAWSFTVDDAIFTDGQSYTLYSKTLDNAENEQVAVTSSVFTWDVTPPIADINGQPTDVSNIVSLVIDVLPTSGLVSYKYKLGLTASTDCTQENGYSAAFYEESENIVANISTLSDGPMKVCVIGRDAAGNTQPFTSPTSAIWDKDTTPPTVDVGADIVTNQATAVDASASDIHTMTYAWTKTSGNGNITFSDASTEDTTISADANILYIIRLTATDAAGNSGYDDLYFTWDLLAPNPDFYINSDVSYTNAIGVALSFFNTTDINEYRVAEGADCSGATYASFTANPISFNVSSGDGTKTVCMQVRDANTNESTTATDTIILDSTPPDSAITTTGTIGPEVTGGSSTTLSGTATDTLSGVNSIKFSLQRQTSGFCLDDAKAVFDQTCPHWLDAVGSFDWTITLNDAIFGDGQNYTLSSKAIDQAANEQVTPTTSVLTWDAAPPDPTFTINSGATYANTTTVNLDIVTTTGVASYRKANGASCTAASWVSFSANPISHVIPSGDSAKTVCLEVKDAVGNVSAAATAVITLDTTNPDTALSVPSFLGPNSTAGANTRFAGTAVDAGSGLQTVDISIEHTTENCFDVTETDFSGTCQVWHTTTTVDSFANFYYDVPDAKFVQGGNYIVKARATDNATNVETSYASATFSWDELSPNPSFSINNNNSHTSSASVNLNIVDATNIFEYRLANSADCSAATWTAFGGNPIAYSLTGGEGSNTVCLQVRDNLTNESGTATDAINLDTVAPQVNSVTSTKPDGNYTVGESITVEVNFTENVIVTGTPLLTLETGTPDRDATYVSGSGTATLSFTYTVQAGDTSGDLDYAATTALQLNGGTIKDAASNNAILTLAALGTASSLAGSGTLVIDTTAPTLTGAITRIATDSTLDLTWPAAAGQTGYILVRRMGSAVSFTPTPGQSYTTGAIDADHELLYKGTLLTFLDSGLSPGTDINYSVFAYDDANNYSARLSLSARALYLTGARKVVQGAQTTCILRADSQVYCFGNASDGRLGYENLDDIGDNPNELGADWPAVNFGTNTQVRDLFSGAGHRCVILMDGRLKCWGDNDVGQLGLEHTNDIGDDVGEMGNNLPEVNLGTGKKALSLALGTQHSCALLDDYTVKCWGHNSNGTLGYEDNINRGDTSSSMGDNLPTVNLGTGRKVRQISAGKHYTCAILDNGTLKCWGINSGALKGCLGLGDAVNHGDDAGEMGDNLPAVNLPTSLAPLKVFTGRGTCVLLSDHSLRCWGPAAGGDVGMDLDPASPPNDYIGDDPSEMGDNLPAINLGQEVRDVLKFKFHTCAILADESLKCWGYNTNGNLGYGDTSNRGDNVLTMASLPADVSLGTGLKAKPFTHDGIANYTTCLVLSDSSVKCFGANTNGELGLGDTFDRGDGAGEMGDNLPKIYMGTATPSPIVKLASGAEARHTCAITQNEKLKCWGRNTYGQLGYGNIASLGDDIGEMGANLSYVDLGTVARVQDATVGYMHTCVLLSTGMVKCFGQNNTGQLGLGDIVDRGDQGGEMGDALPEVSLGTNVWARKIVTDRETTCVLTNSSNVKCWGANTFGMLGTGDSLSRGAQGGEMGDNLANIDLGTDFNNNIMDIYSSSYSICVVNYLGQLKCFGRGTYGLVGGGNSTSMGDNVNEMGDFLPIVPFSKSIVGGEGGNLHYCLMTDDGGVKCFGYAALGRLGYENGNDMGDNAGEIAALPNVDLGNNFWVSKITVFGGTTCALSLAGTVKCWGMGAMGELGTEAMANLGDDAGEMGNALTNIDVGSSVLVRDVYGFDLSTCVLSADFRLKCFGYNINGQLGVEDTLTLGDEVGEMGDNLPWVTVE